MNYICDFKKLVDTDPGTFREDDVLDVFYEEGSTLTMEQHIAVCGIKGKVNYIAASFSEEKIFAIGVMTASMKDGATLILDEVTLSPALMKKYNLVSFGEVKPAKKEKSSESTPVKKKMVVVEEDSPTKEKPETKTENKTEDKPKEEPMPKQDDDPFGGTEVPEETHSDAPPEEPLIGNDYYGNIAKFTEVLDIKAKEYGINTPEGVFVLQIAEDVTGAKDDNDLQRKLTYRFQDKGPRIWNKVKKELDKLRPLAKVIIENK